MFYFNIQYSWDKMLPVFYHDMLKKTEVFSNKNCESFQEVLIKCIYNKHTQFETIQNTCYEMERRYVQCIKNVR